MAWPLMKYTCAAHRGEAGILSCAERWRYCTQISRGETCTKTLKTTPGRNPRQGRSQTRQGVRHGARRGAIGAAATPDLDHCCCKRQFERKMNVCMCREKENHVLEPRSNKPWAIKKKGKGARVALTYLVVD